MKKPSVNADGLTARSASSSAGIIRIRFNGQTHRNKTESLSARFTRAPDSVFPNLITGNHSVKKFRASSVRKEDLKVSYIDILPLNRYGSKVDKTRHEQGGMQVTIKDILLLGNPDLYETSRPVEKNELPGLQETVRDLHDTMMDFRKRYGAGRAIAAPQISVLKRVIYLHIDEPVVFINPSIEEKSSEMMAVWDDCMCFPELLVRVQRHRSCTISYLDMEWNNREMKLEGDLSELLQHEYDHLDGILAVSKAIDSRSFALRSQRDLLP